MYNSTGEVGKRNLGWLQSKGENKAFCKVCQKDVQAKVSVLKAHGKTDLHMRKMNALKDPSVRPLEQVVSHTAETTHLTRKVKEAELNWLLS